MEQLPQLILVVLLLGLNAFFVASEYALVTIRKSRIDEQVKKGNSVARWIARALSDLKSYISATQLGSTIASLALGWLGEPVVAKLISSLFFFLPKGIAGIIEHTVAFIISFILLTYLSIVIGELVPKTLAMQRSEAILAVCIAPLLFFAKLFRPFIKGLTVSGNIIFKIFGVSPGTGVQLIYSKDEIKTILEQVSQNGTVPQQDAEIVQNAFSLHDLPIRRIMVPFPDIVAFEQSITLSQIVRQLESHPTFSRFPIYESDIDNIKGYVHVKDVYRLVLNRKESSSLSELNIIRNIINVPETKKVDEVLSDMRKKHIHLAVVSDEFGRTVGIVTLEDILESLVGEIQDEFDTYNESIRRQDDRTYVLDARISPELVEKKLKLDLGSQGYTTVGGLVFGLLGREPHVGNKITVDHCLFEIDAMEGKRIKTVILRRLLHSSSKQKTFK